MRAAITNSWIEDIGYTKGLYFAICVTAAGRDWFLGDHRAVRESHAALDGLVQRIVAKGEIDTDYWTPVSKTWDEIAEEWEGMAQWEYIERLAGRG